MDIVALGELLIDFTPVGSRQYEANAGGAVANVLAAAAKQGLSTDFIGKVGIDDFGNMLEQDLQKAGVATSGLCKTDEAFTTLAFVSLDSMGDRSFAFARKPGADTLLRSEDIDTSLLDNTRMLHFGSLSLTDEPARHTTFDAIAYARKKGVVISYDPNLRPLLWSSPELAKEMIGRGMTEAVLCKISEEELVFLTDMTDLDAGTNVLLERYPNLQCLLVTLGSEGCYYRRGEDKGTVPGFRAKVVDTTGAGDAFMGGVLSEILLLKQEKDLATMPVQTLVDCIRNGNATGALSTEKKGGIPSMPERSEVLACIEKGTAIG